MAVAESAKAVAEETVVAAETAVADTPLDVVAAAPLAVVAKTVAVRAVRSESAVVAKIGPEEAVVVVAEVAAVDEPDVGTETGAVKVAVAIQAVAVNHPSLV